MLGIDLGRKPGRKIKARLAVLATIGLHAPQAHEEVGDSSLFGATNVVRVATRTHAMREKK
jgi:hypothetical protein